MTSFVIGDAQALRGTIGHRVCIGFCTTELSPKTKHIAMCDDADESHSHLPDMACPINENQCLNNRFL